MRVHHGTLPSCHSSNQHTTCPILTFYILDHVFPSCALGLCCASLFQLLLTVRQPASDLWSVEQGNIFCSIDTNGWNHLNSQARGSIKTYHKLINIPTCRTEGPKPRIACFHLYSVPLTPSGRSIAHILDLLSGCFLRFGLWVVATSVRTRRHRWGDARVPGRKESATSVMAWPMVGVGSVESDSAGADLRSFNRLGRGFGVYGCRSQYIQYM